MDERELANYIIEIVDQAAYRNSVTRVTTVRIAVGGRRCFDLSRLDSIFTEVSRGTVADGARLIVQVLPVQRHCQNCGHNFEAGPADAPCPECGHPHTEAASGEEIRVVDMQRDDSAA